MRSFKSVFAASCLFTSLVEAGLGRSVGPLTTIHAKIKGKECNVLQYGAKADGQTDVGPAISAAFAACKTGGIVVIPAGNYALETWVTLSGGNSWGLQLDGTIHRTGTAGGNMIMIEHSNDFELFSTAAKGAIQGNGYIFHQKGSISGPRILRFYMVNNFSVHDIALVDSPSFHFSLDTCSNGEVYNMAIRGGNEGGLDGIDVWSNNMHIHDIMVTNKDECVTVKSPSNNILIENIYCNWSGGCAFGSLGANTNISDVIYRNIYTVQSNEMMMIKSNGGSGTLKNVILENFIGHSNAYNLDVDQYWDDLATQPGEGVQLDNIVFSNWAVTVEDTDAVQRPPLRFNCADGSPCTNMILRNVNMQTISGDETTHFCRSAYGSGACLKDGDGGRYEGATSTIKAAATGYTPPRMDQDLKSSFGTTASIPIPSIGPSFFPNVAPISRIAGS
ncbi:hypothetical protein ANO11243_019450 [Dothideomycetidae sp. 11243]|nr:hypothetical protein ANO11243_019450 [fungal sp. No.11243]